MMIVDRLLLPKSLDRRCKLSEIDKNDIIKLHKSGVSIHQIAHIYDVNRRLIQFLLYPDRKAKNIKLRLERGGSSIYYDRKKHNQSIKNLREHKVKNFDKLIKK